MQRTVTIFRKELKDILRDRRTLIMMVLVPMLIMPLLIIGLNKLQSSVMEKAQEKELRIGFLGSDYAPDLMNLFQEQERMILLLDFPPDSLRPSISGGELDGAVIIPKSFGKSLKEDAQGEVQIVYKGSEGLGVVKDRLIKVIEEYDRLIVTERVERLNLDPNLFDAVTITELDVSSKQEVIGKLVGGFLPYMFVIFSFMGAMYPGIDLGAGEKERGSLETLLSSPATRLEIVFPGGDCLGSNRHAGDVSGGKVHNRYFPGNTGRCHEYARRQDDPAHSLSGDSTGGLFRCRCTKYLHLRPLVQRGTEYDLARQHPDYNPRSHRTLTGY